MIQVVLDDAVQRRVDAVGRRAFTDQPLVEPLGGHRSHNIHQLPMALA